MIFNTNLPGSSIQVIDEYNTTTYDTSQFGTTESVLVIGTAFDGPVGKEIAIYNPDQAKYIFGGTYDAVAKRSASLVAYIQDLYEKGARTIYAMRVGGKDIQKVYRLREDVPVYLKISGAFPSNKYKDMALLVDMTTDVAGKSGKIEIYKTANKATIEEKREGYVESNESIIKTTINVGAAYTYDLNSPLTDFIEHLNSYTRNNVFRFSLVNEKGEDVTYSEVAKSLSVGAIANGVYTIGRANDSKPSKTSVITAKDTAIGYKNYAGNFVFEVTSNNDIEASWPYVAAGGYKFLERFGGLDDISKKDATDYEEVKMSNFEFYKKLGSGYAQTAQIGEGNIIKPTPTTSTNYTVEIGEGIYTTASNLKTDYRILTGVFADDVITGVKLTQEDFLRESACAIPAAYITQENEETVAAAHAYYKLDNKNTTSYGFDIKIEKDELNKVQGLAKADFDAKFKTKTIIKLSDTLVTGDYGIVEAENAYWVAVGVATNTPSILMPLSMLGDPNPDYLISLKKDGDKLIYTITLSEAFAKFTTAHELTKVLNESAIGNVFNVIYKNEYANNVVVATPTSPTLGTPCREIKVDTTLVLPYTTSDNFVRQLAQHCEYTSLKTYQTHGALGTSPLGDTSIKAVVERATLLSEKDYDLYVKNAVGKPVLDVDNLPYHIGKAVSIVVAQHTIQTLDGYKYVAASHASYIGRASTLDTSISTTNQTIAIAPHYTFGESQKVALNKAGYVTIENKNGIYKVTDGITQAPIYSQFSRFATFRTIKIVDRIIRDATEPFIGKKNDMVNRNSMYTAIKSGLDAILDTYLEKYTFSMQYSKYEARLGNVNIEYSFDIIDEIRNVNNTVRVKS